MSSTRDWLKRKVFCCFGRRNEKPPQLYYVRGPTDGPYTYHPVYTPVGAPYTDLQPPAQIIPRVKRKPLPKQTELAYFVDSFYSTALCNHPHWENYPHQSPNWYAANLWVHRGRFEWATDYRPRVIARHQISLDYHPVYTTLAAPYQQPPAPIIPPTKPKSQPKHLTALCNHPEYESYPYQSPNWHTAHVWITHGPFEADDTDPTAGHQLPKSLWAWGQRLGVSACIEPTAKTRVLSHLTLSLR